jgi:hypothetical protein
MRGYQPLMATDVACCLAALSLTVLQHFRFLRPGLGQNVCHQENDDKSTVCVIGVTDALLNALGKRRTACPHTGTARYAQITNYRSQNFKFRIASAQNL